MGTIQLNHFISPLRIASRKFRSAVHKLKTERFYVLDSEPTRLQSRVPIEFTCAHGLARGAGAELTRLTRKDANWRGRFELGHRCILAHHDGKLVGSIWVCPGAWLVGKEQPVGPLASDVAFVYDGFVCESMRGLRIASARLVYVFDEMKQQGFGRNCTTVEDENIPSVRSVLQVGYRTTDCLVQVNRWMMVHRTVEGGPPPEVLS